MTTPSPDDKILQLVRAILDAVDARLATVRREFATTVEQMEQRHRQVLDALAAFNRRLDAVQAPAALRAPGAATTAAPAEAPVTAATPTLRADTGPILAPSLASSPAGDPAGTAAPAQGPSGQGDTIDLTEVARLVQERLADLRLPSLDERTGT